MSPEIAAQTVVDGRYRIISRIGSGGMADVYCAHDEQLGRNIAIKLLHRRFVEDPQFVERFRREAQSAAGLQHPNIVNVYDRGEWDGTYYIAMEYLEGRNLKELIRAEGPLDQVRAIGLCEQICRAARFAHRRGIVHRDLKPHNVIVDAEDRLKVTDFGIARAGASDMTETGSIMGTAQYLSPEQAQGIAVGPASDIYSVGVVLYEMLTGRVPFEAESAVTIALRHVSEPPTPPGHLVAVDPALENVVMQALAKDPAHRFADADEMIAALESARAHIAAGGSQMTAPFTVPEGAAPPPLWSPPPDEPVAEGPGRSRLPFVLVVLLLVLGAVAAALLLTGGGGVKVPDVVGRDVQAGAAILANAGLEPRAQRIPSDEVPRGRIFRQDPQPGAEVDEGAAVTLLVSDGPEEAVVPPLTGIRERSARARLRRAGFTEVRVDRESSDTVPRGEVISAVPASGVRVAKDTEVTLTVSSGRDRVEVPRLVGASREDAERALAELELEPRVTERASEDDEPGTVLEQSPAPGEEVEEGSEVGLVVAKEPEVVRIPDVVGLDAAEAANRLEEAGLRVRYENEPVERPSEDGRVVRQAPGAGRRVKRGARVTIFVGQFTLPEDPEGGGEPPPGQ